MNFNNIDVEINPDYTMMKKIKNGLYLSQEQIDVLEEYSIDYMKCNNLSELIFIVENSGIDDDVIINLLDILSERNYYENYKKWYWISINLCYNIIRKG